MRRKIGFVTLIVIMVMTAMFSMETLAAGNQEWRWPVPGSDKMSSCFLDGRNHYAIDIQADMGEEVYATYVGEVVAVFDGCTHNYCKYYSCGCDGGLGNNVYIRHIYNGHNYVSRYGHLSEVFVTVGQMVDEETLIGTVGTTGYSSGNHLDYRVFEGYSDMDDRRENAIDPLAEQFVEIPEGFHANATTWCCYQYADEIRGIYEANPKVVDTNVTLGRHYLCDSFKIQLKLAVIGARAIR